jgi:hypothetical protein
MTADSHWRDLTAQQLVRYEALFTLLDDIQSLEDTGHRTAGRHSAASASASRCAQVMPTTAATS